MSTDVADNTRSGRTLSSHTTSDERHHSRSEQTRRTGLETWINWLYTHHRRRYVWILVAVTASTVEVAVPFLVFALSPVVAIGYSGLWLTMSIMVPASLLGIPTLCWVVRTHHSSAIEYLRGDDPGPAADEVWRTSVAELATGVLMIVCGYWVPLAAGAVLLGIRLDKSLAVTALFIYSTAVGAALVGVFFFLLWEAALRPLARELGPQLSPGILRESRGPSISVKLFVLLTLISLFNGFVVGSVSLIPTSSHDT
jgi:hypothetical protein